MATAAENRKWKLEQWIQRPSESVSFSDTATPPGKAISFYDATISEPDVPDDEWDVHATNDSA